MLRQSVTSLSRHRRRSPAPPSLFLFKSLSSASNPSQPTSYSAPQPPKILHFGYPTTSIATPNHLKIFQNLRQYSVDTSHEVDEINLKFAEAREEIDMAMESKETVYFNEEAECARDAVKEVLEMYEGLLAKLPEQEKGVIQRSMGLKLEQLKAELEQLNE